MKKVFIFLMLFMAVQAINAQTLRRAVSSTYDVSGDNTITVNFEFSNAASDKVRYSGYAEFIVLVDSLNGNGVFSTSGTSDIEMKPRFKLNYDNDENDSAMTWYTSTNDSTAVQDNYTWKIGVNQFNADVTEADGAAFELNFDAGDTLRVICILIYQGEN